VKLSLRFLVPLIIVLAALTLAAMPVIDQLTLRWFMKDLDLRASLIASTVEEPVQRLESDPGALRAYFARLILDERLFAVGYCAEGAVRPEGTSTLPASVQVHSRHRQGGRLGHVVRDAHGPLLISNKPIRDVRGSRASHRRRAGHELRRAAQRGDEAVPVLLLRRGRHSHLADHRRRRAAELARLGAGMRSLLRGEGLLRPTGRTSVGELQPIADDLRALIRDLESEHRMRDDEQLAWTPKTLRGILERELRGSDVIVVSNREPFIHVRAGGGDIAIQRPGERSRRRDRADRARLLGHVDRPWQRLGGPRRRGCARSRGRSRRGAGYQLGAVWLTKEEEQGLLLWIRQRGALAALPRRARAPDVPQQRLGAVRAREPPVRRRRSIAEARTSDPVVLVQDYHLALVRG
jgi:trehalose 6-phosphate synthase